MKFKIIFLLLTFFLLNSACQKEILEHEASDLQDEEIEVRGPKNWLSFYKGASTNKIFLAQSDDGNPFTEVGSFLLGEATGRTPSAVKFGNNIYCYYRGKRSNTLGYVTGINNGNTWQNNTVVNNSPSFSSGPSAVVFNGEIFVFMPIVNTLYYFRSSNGVNYTGPTEVVRTGNPSGVLNLVSPNIEVAPVVHQGRLYVFYARHTTGFGPKNDIYAINTSTGNFGDWISVNNNDPINEKTSTGMSAISTDSEIMLTFSGYTSRKVYEKRIITSGSNGQNLSFSWSNHIGGYTTDRPGIARDGSKVVILYKDGTGTGSNLIAGDEVTLPSYTWSGICSGSSNTACYAGYTSYGVSVVHTGF